MVEHPDDEELFWKEENDDYVIASLSVLVAREVLIFHNKSCMETSIWAEPFWYFSQKEKNAFCVPKQKTLFF